MHHLQRHPPSPLRELYHPLVEAAGIRLLIKQEVEKYLSAYPGDQAFGGNKWHKLKYNLIKAREENFTTLLTFGGAFSNHIAATASAGQLFGFQTVGVIRGDANKRNPTLLHAEKCGMRLHFLDRSTYRQKDSPELLESLRSRFKHPFIIPEGGTNEAALRGCREWGEEILTQVPPPGLPDYCSLPCGTGGTFAGLVSGFGKQIKSIGFPVLKGDFLSQRIAELLSQNAPGLTTNWELVSDYHFGGYARFTPELIRFINRFKHETGIALDPIYSGKHLYGIFDLIVKGYFPRGCTLLAIHTGGLQGIAGFNNRFGNLLY